jgi:hypothetical protein
MPASRLSTGGHVWIAHQQEVTSQMFAFLNCGAALAQPTYRPFAHEMTGLLAASLQPPTGQSWR